MVTLETLEYKLITFGWEKTVEYLRGVIVSETLKNFDLCWPWIYEKINNDNIWLHLLYEANYDFTNLAPALIKKNILFPLSKKTIQRILLRSLYTGNKVHNKDLLPQTEAELIELFQDPTLFDGIRSCAASRNHSTIFDTLMHMGVQQSPSVAVAYLKEGTLKENERNYLPYTFQFMVMVALELTKTEPNFKGIEQFFAEHENHIDLSKLFDIRVKSIPWDLDSLLFSFKYLTPGTKLYTIYEDSLLKRDYSILTYICRQKSCLCYIDVIKFFISKGWDPSLYVETLKLQDVAKIIDLFIEAAKPIPTCFFAKPFMLGETNNYVSLVNYDKRFVTYVIPYVKATYASKDIKKVQETIDIGFKYKTSIIDNLLAYIEAISNTDDITNHLLNIDDNRLLPVQIAIVKKFEVCNTNLPNFWGNYLSNLTQYYTVGEVQEDLKDPNIVFKLVKSIPPLTYLLTAIRQDIRQSIPILYIKQSRKVKFKALCLAVLLHRYEVIAMLKSTLELTEHEELHLKHLDSLKAITEK